jgi:hypothetical protein
MYNFRDRVYFIYFNNFVFTYSQKKIHAVTCTNKINGRFNEKIRVVTVKIL